VTLASMATCMTGVNTCPEQTGKFLFD